MGSVRAIEPSAIEVRQDRTGPSRYIIEIDRFQIIIDRDVAEMLRDKLLSELPPEPDLVTEPFVSSYDLAEHVKQQAVAMARLQASGLCDPVTGRRKPENPEELARLRERFGVLQAGGQP
jgi:hypothetical protein